MTLEDIIPDSKESARVGMESPNKSGKWKDEEWLREQYITLDKTQNAIAKECGVNKGTIRYWRNKFGISKGRKCPECDHQSEGLGNHFAQADHGYPELPRTKREILVGHVMGDAWYDVRDGGYGGLGWEMKNKRFMEWLVEELEWVAGPPTSKRTPQQHADASFLRDSNYGSADPDKYSTTYSSHTVSHPWFERLDWMGDDGKEFPETLQLTPTMVKVWYCDDGTLAWSGLGRPSARITVSSQEDKLELLADKFQDVVCRPTVSGDDLVFNVNETEELMAWMGEAPVGMEYKFEINSKQEYKQLKEGS